MLSLYTAGFDTLTPVFEFSEALPLTDSNFKDELVRRGWVGRSQTRMPRQPNGDFFDFANPIESFNYSYQSPHNSTLRYFIYGSRVRAEYSAPRLINDSPINIVLASPSHAIDSIYLARDILAEIIPFTQPDFFNFVKLMRADFAIDVACREYSVFLFDLIQVTAKPRI